MYKIFCFAAIIFDETIEPRVKIKYLVKLKKTATKPLNLLCDVCGEGDNFLLSIHCHKIFPARLRDLKELQGAVCSFQCIARRTG